MKIAFFFIFFFISFVPDVFSEEIKIGSLLHLSGDYAMEGNAFLEGMYLGVEKFNKDNLKNDLSIVLDSQDSRYIPTEIVSLAHRAKEDSSVKALLVSTFFEIRPIAPIVEKSHLPTLVLWDATPEIDNYGDYVFSIGPWAPDTGEKCARFSHTKLRAKKAFVISQHHDWSLAVSKSFKDKFISLGGNLSEMVLNREENDFKTYLLKVRRAKPDVVYAPLVHNITTFVKQFKLYLPTTPLVMSDNFTEHLISEDVSAFEGVYHSMVADPDNDESRELIRLYKMKYGKEPSLLIFNAWGYDSILLIGEVIKRGARTRDEIKDGLYKIKGLPLAGGEINMLPTGSAPKYISMFQVRDGKFILISEPDPEIKASLLP